MCMGSAPSTPPVPPPTPRYAPPKAPEIAAEDARADETLRRRAASGRSGTLLTGPLGLTGAASTTGKTLLGA